MENSDYITKEYFKHTLDATIDKRFSEFEERLDKKFDQKFDDFAAIIAKGFSDVYKKFDEQEASLKEYMSEHFASKTDLYESEARLKNEIGEVKEEVSLINEHLGRMEVRFGHLDNIVVKDHRPRIKNLELAVGI